MTLVFIALGIGVFFLILRLLGTSTQERTPDNVSEKAIYGMAMQGKKIQAIKAYRQRHGGSLKDAKAAVEEMTNKS